MPDNRNARLSKRQVRAIAYGLADEIETRALALIAREPSLDRQSAVMRAILDMGAKL
jgi:hypothetical protein